MHIMHRKFRSSIHQTTHDVHNRVDNTIATHSTLHPGSEHHYLISQQNESARSDLSSSTAVVVESFFALTRLPTAPAWRRHLAC
jgi:hypothetical protein